jgi:hypothetical protein
MICARRRWRQAMLKRLELQLASVRPRGQAAHAGVHAGQDGCGTVEEVSTD